MKKKSLRRKSLERVFHLITDLDEYRFTETRDEIEKEKRPKE